IPAVSLTYFDVDDNEYKTVSTNETIIDVIGSAPILTTDSRAGDVGPGAVGADAGSAGQKQEVVMVNKDILDIKEGISILSSPFQFDFSFFVLLVLAPGLVYGCIAFVLRFQTREKSNETMMTQRARQSFKTAEKLAASGKPFLNHVQSGLIASILAKGDKQGESLTCDEARQILKQNRTEQKIIDEVVSMLETLDANRFGGQIMDNSRDCLSPGRVKQTIKMLSIILCCLGVFILYSPIAFAQDNIGRTGTSGQIDSAGSTDSADLTGSFIDGIRQYQAGEFKNAAASFEAIAASGVVNPDLFYNIGNAYLKAKDLGQAILWYERAKRLSPGDPDLVFNLAYANTLVKDRINSPVTMTDIFFFWQGLVPLKWLQAGAIASSCLFFLWAGVQTFRQKRIFSGPGWVFVSLLLLLFLAAGMEDYRARAANLAVIVQDSAAVRSGIMETSTKLFELHAGTRVQVKAKRNGYLKIRLAKGRVGWVKPGDAKV
ncbi:MAG: tetratricopeptide repeat protein, partial [Desulfobacteraceae bacterium]|nr:tetratricopeptide repeat protein [Desulfobacteraceae bacterium]